jgi:phosphopantetheinyl transferase (holo-ACP synthase)
MKKVIKLKESDIENLVKRIIKEEGENQDGDPVINIKDVQHFMEVMDTQFFNRAAGKQATKRINNNIEKAGLIAAMIMKFGVDMQLVNRAKQQLQKSGYDPK